MRSFAFIFILGVLFFLRKPVYAQAYTLGNTAGNVGWFKLGRLQLTQGGKDAELRIIAGIGYTGISAQLGECLIHFRTSNGDGEVGGFFGAGMFTVTGRSKITKAVKVVQITTSVWDFYASLDVYSGDGATLTLNSRDGVWTPGFSFSDRLQQGQFFWIWEMSNIWEAMSIYLKI